MSLEVLWAVFLVAFAILGAGTDLISRRIPNLLCIAAAIAGLGLSFASGGLEALGSHAGHGAIALVAGFLLFQLGAWGGGDGKFYPAMASFFPLSQGILLAVTITLLGVLVVAAWFLSRLIYRKASKAKGDFAKLPYGVAIALGAIVVGLVLK